MSEKLDEILANNPPQSTIKEDEVQSDVSDEPQEQCKTEPYEVQTESN